MGPDAETVSKRSGPCVTPECEGVEWVMTTVPVGYQAWRVEWRVESGYGCHHLALLIQSLLQVVLARGFWVPKQLLLTGYDWTTRVGQRSIQA